MIPLDWLDTLATPFIRRGAGVAVAGALEDETAFRFHGRVHKLGPPPTENTLFELGGVTELFTAILLALMVRKGRLEFDAPVASLVPELGGLPEWVTPLRLATHTAGMPRVPREIARRSALNMSNPYARFSFEDLAAWAKSFRRKQPPAEGDFTYSVVGMGLLGFVLEEINRKRLGELFDEKIMKPLGLADTAYRLSEDQEARLATPHDGKGKPVAAWEFNALAGAGGLKSSAADVAKLMRAVLAAPSAGTELGKAIADTLEIRRRPPQASGEGGGLGWSIVLAGKPPAFVFTLTGRTNGSQAFLFVAPQPKLGAAVLVNAGPRARDALNPPRRQMLKTFAMAWAALPEGASPSSPSAD